MRERLLKTGIVPLPTPTGAAGGAPGTVVMLHGKDGIKEHALPIAERFVAGGFYCITYDARAHGTSGGKFSTYGAKETDDLTRIIDEAERLFGRNELGEFTLFGNSLGSAVALQALTKETRLRAAVVTSPFASLAGLIDENGQNRLPAYTPLLRTPVLWYSGWRAGFDPWSIAPAQDAANIHTPVMVVHGEDDTFIRPHHGREIFDALPGPEKVWRPVLGGTHFNVLAKGNDELYQEMIEFYWKALANKQPSPNSASADSDSAEEPVLASPALFPDEKMENEQAVLAAD